MNLGLRWDYEGPVTERYNRLVRGFAFDQPSPLAEKVRNAAGAANCPACANLKGGLLFAGAGGVPRGLFEPDRNNFQPRIGAAFQLDSKTVLRGEYGIYFSPTTELGSQTGFFVPTTYVDQQGRPGVAETSFNSFSNSFRRGRDVPPGTSLGLLTQAGFTVSSEDPRRVVPHIYQFNFSIQRHLTPNLLVDAAFVGSRSRKLPVNRPYNFVPWKSCARDCRTCSRQ